jgi:hypothetical protein
LCIGTIKKGGGKIVNIWTGIEEEKKNEIFAWGELSSQGANTI